MIDATSEVDSVPGMNLLMSLAPKGALDVAFGEGQDLQSFARERRAEYKCVMRAIRVRSASEMTTDAVARGKFPAVPAGTYYLFGRFYRVTKPVRAGGMIWDMKVTLQPGQNIIPLTVSAAAVKRAAGPRGTNWRVNRMRIDIRFLTKPLNRKRMALNDAGGGLRTHAGAPET